ncbi:MAG TPA: hypothetical protein VIV60_08230 [Polyangiaceae bacterium]
MAPDNARNTQQFNDANPADERNCAVCGKEMKPFGFVDHELFTFVPAKIVVNVDRCEKLGCDCRKVLSGVFDSLIVAADDSHVKVSNKSGKHGAFRGHICCFDGTDGAVSGPETVAYGYTKSWDATEVADWPPWGTLLQYR